MVCAMAVNGRCVGHEYAYIVQHGRLFYEGTVDVQFGVIINDFKRPIRHLFAMFYEQFAQRLIIGIILIYNI